MIELEYSEDEYDILRELFNVAMGQAGKSLALLLKSFVELSVPDIKIVHAEKVINTIIENSPFTENEIITAVRQTFYNQNHVDGETIVLFGDNSFVTIAEILGLAGTSDENFQKELLLEIANIVGGASINGFSNQLFGNEMTFTPPTILNEKTPLNKLLYGTFMRSQIRWAYTLLIKIKFKLKHEDFKSGLLVFMSEKSIETIKAALDKKLEEM
ncbi:MAG: hypothetical protein HQK89_07520 [Nitrospirae bacterium]|nr:hypothetical protein [Nitrospirota bacterium]